MICRGYDECYGGERETPQSLGLEAAGALVCCIVPKRCAHCMCTMSRTDARDGAEGPGMSGWKATAVF